MERWIGFASTKHWRPNTRSGVGYAIGDDTMVSIGNFASDDQLYSWKLWAKNSLGFSDPTTPWTFINSDGGGAVVGEVPLRIIVRYQI